jgi:hypothetical protein
LRFLMGGAAGAVLGLDIFAAMLMLLVLTE